MTLNNEPLDRADSSEGDAKDLNARGGANATHAETLAGTPLYVAPESITSPDTVDGRADLYSLGALAYFLLVGEPVFVQPSIVAVCAAHLHRVILRCLEKRPDARFGSATALRDALLATPPAGTWTRESAAGWWSERRAEFRAPSDAVRLAPLERNASAASPESAVRVDLRGRLSREA